MPNHVTNILTFKGPKEDIQALRNHTRSVDENGDEIAFDFNKIIPMPESLRITAGSRVDNGIAILKFLEHDDETELRKMLDWAWVKAENITTPQQLAEYMINKNTADIEEARVALDNIKKYGFKDWYSWSVANWGTKWNAYDISEEDNGISFDTAWSSPIPIIEELSNQFPTIEMKLQFADEDFGHNCGIIVFLAGDAIEENIPDGGSPEAYKIAIKIQGGEIDNVMWYICDSNSEEFIRTMIPAILEVHKVETFMWFIEMEDSESFSETFLKEAKSALIDLEAYEHISVIDEKLRLKEVEN